ncbi:MAG: hypothetical protein AAFU34_15555 [Pseudomonadota bacterium]
MVRVSPMQVSMGSGEIGSLLHGRSDFVRYQNGLKKCRGFMVLPEGIATRTPGTAYIGRVESNKPARLMAFTFRDEDAVMLEWTDRLLRFWRSGSLISSGAVPYSVATPYEYAELDKIQALQSSDRLYLASGTRAPHRVSRFALDNWTIDPTPFIGGPFLPENLDRAVEITPSATTGAVTLQVNADLFEPGHVGVQFRLRIVNQIDAPIWTSNTPISVGDQMYFGGSLYELIGFDNSNGRSGSAAPSISDPGDGSTPTVSNVSGGPIWDYVSTGTNEDAMDFEANEQIGLGDRRHVSGYIVQVAAFPATGRTTGVINPSHTSGDVLTEKGGPIWRHVSDGTGIVRITDVAGPRNASASVEINLPDGLANAPTYRWSEGAWSDLQGWPSVIGSFESRVVYAGTRQRPRDFWASVIGGNVDMTETGDDDDGFSYGLEPPRRRLGELRAIQKAGDALVMLTSGDEFFGTATDADRAWSINTARFGSDSNRGCAPGEALSIDGLVLFIHKTSRRLYMLRVNENGRLVPENLTATARHILGPGCVKIVYQEEPLPLVWCLLSNGEVAGCSFAPDEQLLGWHRHNMAGGVVEDIEVLPTADGGSEQLWMIVRREVGGEIQRFVEVMQPPFVDLDGVDVELSDAWMQCCATRYQGPATNVIPGFDHLEGQTIIVWTEIGAFTDLIVTSGSVNLPDGHTVTSAIGGLDPSQTQSLETLNVGPSAADGGSTGRPRAHRVTGVRLHRSAGGTCAVVTNDQGQRHSHDPKQIIPRRSLSELALVDGDFEIKGMKSQAAEVSLLFEPEPGAPLTLQLITPTVMVADS